MNKKVLIICISVIAALVLLVAGGVFFLYHGRGDKPSGAAPESFRGDAVASCPILEAVPADAAMIMTFGNLNDASYLLNDSTKIFGAILTNPGFKSFTAGLKDVDFTFMKDSKALVSMHYSEKMVPLMIVDAGKSPMVDTTDALRSLFALADSSKVLHSVLDCSGLGDGTVMGGKVLALFSPSHTLLLASQRHIEGGMSVLDQQAFPAAMASAGSRNAVLLSHDYASKVLKDALVRPYYNHGGFISRVAEWTGLGIRTISDASITMEGEAVCPANMPSFFSNVWKKDNQGEVAFSEILPSTTLFAVSLPINNLAEYMEAYKRYVDATGRLDKRKSAARPLADSAGIAPETWAVNLNIKEVVVADIVMGKNLGHILLVRPGIEDKDILLKGTRFGTVKECVQPHKNVYRGFAANLFGELFAVQDGTSAIYKDGWIIVGNDAVTRQFAGSGQSMDESSVSLSKLLSYSGVSLPKNANMVSFFSAGADPSRLEKIFAKDLLAQIRLTMTATAGEYAVLSASGSRMTLKVDRVDITKAGAVAEEIAGKDTTVVIPQGPFKVRNSGTGATNLFSQAPNGTLTLKEEGGKGIWGVPFKGRLCGSVEAIDYYANGKLQYIFASGSSLYLIDRLGRFVNPFPVDLGKEILLGPAMYDFTGAKGYSAMVIHKDNTIGLYDLHGNKVKGWQGISPKETVKSLPELITVGGKRYWAVRTSLRTEIFGFNGGEPLTKNKGDKMIRPDSELKTEGGSLRAICLDGKEREIKI